MLHFHRFVLENGLRVIVHEDETTPFVVLNVLYDVGSKDEHPQQTGFAHLFEHLMFGGSVNIPNYDTELQKAGGDNNAFTNTDYTNYYLSLPAQNIETGFWLESDRMLQLDFSEHKLEVQRKVVIEEYRQRYLNQPYGDTWLLLRNLAYTTHPYQWPTIGKDITHIENATLDHVQKFFYSHYAPNNAILVIAGNININKAKTLTKKWFGPIPKRIIKPRQLPAEPPQHKLRKLEVKREVPANSITLAFHTCKRNDIMYPATDYLSDILGNGHSSRLYQKMIKEKQLFTGIDSYITGELDPGLLVISGKLKDNISFESAEEAIQEELMLLCNNMISEKELEKIKNKAECQFALSRIELLSKAMNLAFYELLGNANLYNTEIEKYKTITAKQLIEAAKIIFRPENCSILRYQKSS